DRLAAACRDFDQAHSRRSPRSVRQESSGLPWVRATAPFSQAATTAMYSARVGRLPEVNRQPCMSVGEAAGSSPSEREQAASASTSTAASRGMLHPPFRPLPTDAAYASPTAWNRPLAGLLPTV